MELAVHYLLAYLNLLITWPGRYSVNGVMGRGDVVGQLGMLFPTPNLTRRWYFTKSQSELKTLHLHFILKQKPNLVLLITFVDFFCPLNVSNYLWTKIDQWQQ